MIYATDLDRTIIFSNKFLDDCEENVVCVEMYENKPISYMTIKALESLKELKADPNLKVIPITTRSVAQFKRVGAVQDCEFAITSNGGNILYNGVIFEPWKKHIDSVLEKYKNEFKGIEEYLLRFEKDFEKMPTFVDGMFIYVKLLDNDNRNQEILNHLDNDLDKDKWSFTLQGLKLYVIPKEISKENALSYLKTYLKEDRVAVSGDGKLDLGFLKFGDIRIIPEGSEVLDYIPNKEFIYKSIPEGLEGTVDLFKIIKDSLVKNYKV